MSKNQIINNGLPHGVYRNDIKIGTIVRIAFLDVNDLDGIVVELDPRAKTYKGILDYKVVVRTGQSLYESDIESTQIVELKGSVINLLSDVYGTQSPTRD